MIHVAILLISVGNIMVGGNVVYVIRNFGVIKIMLINHFIPSRRLWRRDDLQDTLAFLVIGICIGIFLVIMFVIWLESKQ